MTGARRALVLLGVAGMGYGLVLLLDRSWGDVARVVGWLVAGVLVHDLLLAPAVIAGWFLLTRLPTGRWRAPLAAGLVVWGALTVVAVPVLGRFGERPDNPTLLDRDYTTGWLVVTALVAAGVIIGVLGTGRPRRTTGGGHGESTRRRRRPDRA